MILPVKSLISYSLSLSTIYLSITVLVGCQPKAQRLLESTDKLDVSVPELIVLGVAQDAGFPQAACKKSCCTAVWPDKSKRKMVSCLGLRDPITGKAWLFDATPDFRDQQRSLLSNGGGYELDGIFLTHAHMGHYTGLMHLGREAMGAAAIKVYAMPRMKTFLENNGPWSQLVNLGNISIIDLADKQTLALTPEIEVTPLQVPHRDEFSETVGYLIETVSKKVLFIPDIDKWAKWETDIVSLIREVDLAFLDGTFYQNGEIWGRDMSQIPHPFIVESMQVFSQLSTKDKQKIHFIHLNHTNPLLGSTERPDITPYRTATEGQVIPL